MHGSGHEPKSARFDEKVLQSGVEVVPLAFRAQSIVTGDFIWDRRHVRELATLAEDGSVHILQRNGVDTRAYSEEENRQRAWEREHVDPNAQHVDQQVNLKRELSWQSSTSMGLEDIGALQAAAGPARLLTMDLSYKQTADLMVMDTSLHRLTLLRTPGERLRSAKDTTNSAIVAEATNVQNF